MGNDATGSVVEALPEIVAELTASNPVTKRPNISNYN
jgi:hypothetical protein